jgi:hypothetical protein
MPTKFAWTKEKRARDLSVGLIVAHMADARNSLDSAIEVAQFALGDIDGSTPGKCARLVVDMRVALTLVQQAGRVLTSIADAMIPNDDEKADATQASPD